MGWSVYCRNCWSSGIVTQPSIWFIETDPTSNIASEQQFCGSKDHTGCHFCQQRKIMLQVTPKLHNRRLEKYALVWSFFFELQHLDGSVRMWHKQFDSIDPACLLSTWTSAWTCYCYFLGTPSFRWASFKCRSLTKYGCWPCPCPFMSTVVDHTHHKAHTISNWFLEHDNELTVLQWPPVTRSHFNADFDPYWHDAIISIWTKV